MYGSSQLEIIALLDLYSNLYVTGMLFYTTIIKFPQQIQRENQLLSPSSFSSHLFNNAVRLSRIFFVEDFLQARASIGLPIALFKVNGLVEGGKNRNSLDVLQCAIFFREA